MSKTDEKELDSATLTAEAEESSSKKEGVEKSYRYNLTVSESFYKRIHRKMRAISLITNTRVGKNAWILEAIEKKLVKAKSDEPFEEFPQTKTIQIILPEHIANQLHSRISIMKKYTGKASIKAWIVDAIEKNLD